MTDCLKFTGMLSSMGIEYEYQNDGAVIKIITHKNHCCQAMFIFGKETGNFIRNDSI